MEKYRIDASKGLEFGLYSIGDYLANPHTGTKISPEQRIQELIEASKLADEAGLDVFAVGESHQEDFTTQAHTVILGAIAQATKNIKIASSATVLSTSDPVRVYEDFATIDLISNGRAEIVAGRGSRVGAYSLLGYDVHDYEELFEEKMELLLKLNNEKSVTWNGQFRAPLNNATILPQPLTGQLPIWRAVGGPPSSAIKAGYAGVPMMLTTLGGPAINFKGSVDAYRETAAKRGFDPATLPVATTSLFYTAANSQDALREYYPHINYGMQALRGGGYPKQQFAQSTDYRDALMIGSPQQMIEKMLYQYELYGQQRFMAQIDFGGVPFDKIAKNIELIATEIMPAIKKHTAKK
ncbi:LLM class flavin-dependent oxidoreductase [Paenibacillus macquariensis]|uniref:Flavin-dependent oxidoreductase, luciferase family (Includes alkanesulfonate monooxygenase SsuD and methylene tetrahydromethanopterin reductase) n=1 Tax=Paenibacillus macquariensis TaxID=948756 RepID=A0ABY1JPW8_9BACL|nr:LLM class flavin-dependent oxidoreductase [Paenibacillus macquariensis]MEC0091947.1 LLM class flavin-dependent oxidoreductase [Paenibacillus macquariensis]OAB37478.1 luciferase [Paenibacillus macquariensis subsp. macquariensis]SIQ54266.1 Flavin-dependent oxidoreductase, luciferase family (includes alkanesulfonate monooxygenase SsuD and methylene tetrahydromethanopterin reductase) [Paenibacillus macquariensis]